MKIKLVAAALVAGLATAACSAAGTASEPAPAATASAGAATAAAGATAGKVSANTADESRIAAALKAAGVDNPERWAEEVVEYRPYAADDADLTSLRQNLAKYNPGEDTVNKIVSALTP
ncbi:hypothetical protein [Nonomuraea montanisoli]|uniref:hypothetical protein n=1 Tax=Nonomuraea montanisoli TaxID=2741721 RepID=UPI001966ADAC|nr:hypothetical protein [Nonomuraea montanisoli]